MTDEELDLIPANLSYFEKVIAVSPYGAVSRSKDLETARKRGNSRVRKALERFLSARGHQFTDAAIRASYDQTIGFIVNNEGFAHAGALFSTNTHRPFLLVRARANVGLPDLDQEEFDRLWHDATPDGRKSLRKFARRVAELRRGHNRWPELANLLPQQDFIVPVASDRARRIEWQSLPAPFRSDAEEVFRQTLRQPDDLKAWAKEQMRLGQSAVEIDAEIAARVGKDKKKLPKSTEAALAGYRHATTWLLRESFQPETGFAGLGSLQDVFTTEGLEVACEAQIARSAASTKLKNSGESSTLWSRFTNLTTIARHGLRDPEILARINLVRMFNADYVLSPIEMTKDVETICNRLRKSPQLAAAFVNAPARLGTISSEELKAASTGLARERALRLSACAAAYAVQVSRALRPANLFHDSPQSDGGVFAQPDLDRGSRACRTPVFRRRGKERADTGCQCAWRRRASALAMGSGRSTEADGTSRHRLVTLPLPGNSLAAIAQVQLESAFWLHVCRGDNGTLGPRG